MLPNLADRSMSCSGPVAFEYNVAEVTDRVVSRAGALAEDHAVRAHDNLQLASALDVRTRGERYPRHSTFDWLRLARVSGSA
jgi:hypothetical protein